MSELTVAGNLYFVGKMAPRTQFHVARRIAPLAGALVASMAAQAPASDGEADIAKALEPLSEALAQMSDTDADFIIDACLAVVTRQDEKHGGKVRTPVGLPNGRMMFDDIGLPEMMQLVWAVIQDNLGPFFGALGQTLAPTSAETPQTA